MNWPNPQHPWSFWTSLSYLLVGLAGSWWTIAGGAALAGASMWYHYSPHRWEAQKADEIAIYVFTLQVIAQLAGGHLAAHLFLGGLGVFIAFQHSRFNNEHIFLMVTIACGLEMGMYGWQGMISVTLFGVGYYWWTVAEQARDRGSRAYADRRHGQLWHPLTAAAYLSLLINTL